MPLAPAEQSSQLRARDRVQALDRAATVEMERHGFVEAMHANQEVGALVVRGISHLPDAKDVTDAEDWQAKAAENAAAFGFEVLAKT